MNMQQRLGSSCIAHCRRGLLLFSFNCVSRGRGLRPHLLIFGFLRFMEWDRKVCRFYAVFDDVKMPQFERRWE